MTGWSRARWPWRGSDQARLRDGRRVIGSSQACTSIKLRGPLPSMSRTLKISRYFRNNETDLRGGKAPGRLGPSPAPTSGGPCVHPPARRRPRLPAAQRYHSAAQGTRPGPRASPAHPGWSRALGTRWTRVSGLKGGESAKKNRRVEVSAPTFRLDPCPGPGPALARLPHTEQIHQTALPRIGGSSDHNVRP